MPKKYAHEVSLVSNKLGTIWKIKGANAPTLFPHHESPSLLKVYESGVWEADVCPITDHGD